MQNCVINMPISVGLQKNSPLKPKIDSYLTRVIEAGLVEKWLNEAMFKIRATEAEHDTDAIKALMNLSKLYGAIAVLLCGYVISIFTLLVELIVWYGYEKRRPEFDEYNLTLYYAQKEEKSTVKR